MSAEGLYLVNATGDMVPLHTVDGDYDEQLLREYVDEWDLFEDTDTTPSINRSVSDAPDYFYVLAGQLVGTRWVIDGREGIIRKTRRVTNATGEEYASYPEVVVKFDDEKRRYKVETIYDSLVRGNHTPIEFQPNEYESQKIAEGWVNGQ